MKVEIKFWDDEGRLTRTLSSEGSRADIAHGLVALAAEWKQYLPSRTPIFDEDRDTSGGFGQLVELIRQHHGDEAAADLARRLAADEDKAPKEFFELMMKGKVTMNDLPTFIVGRIRQQILSAVPDISESLLDPVMAMAANGLREYAKDVMK